MKSAFLSVLGFFAAIVVIAAIVLGGWEIGWWFNTQNVNREAHLNRNGYSNQQTLRDQINQNISNVQSLTVQISEIPGSASQLKAQRYAIVNMVCSSALQVTGDPLPPFDAQFVSTNCLGGSVNPGSVYAQGVNP